MTVRQTLLHSTSCLFKQTTNTSDGATASFSCDAARYAVAKDLCHNHFHLVYAEPHEYDLVTVSLIETVRPVSGDQTQ